MCVRGGGGVGRDGGREGGRGPKGRVGWGGSLSGKSGGRDFIHAILAHSNRIYFTSLQYMPKILIVIKNIFISFFLQKNIL